MRTLIIGFAALVGGTIVLAADGNASVGGVLVGAGLVACIDGLREWRDDRAKVERDLDETRRLLYAALAATDGQHAASPELAGTVVNALAHHSKLMSQVEARDYAAHIAAGDAATPHGLTDLTRNLIAVISQKLGDARPQ